MSGIWRSILDICTLTKEEMTLAEQYKRRFGDRKDGRLMRELDAQYPQYGFAKHKGYGTAAHYAALREYGPSPIHRPTYLRKMH